MTSTSISAATAGSAGVAAAAAGQEQSQSAGYSVYAQAFQHDASATIDTLLTYLPLSAHLHDYDRSNYYLRKLLNLLDQRHELTPQQRVTFIQQVLAILHTEGIEIHLSIRCLQVLTSLLKKKKNLQLEIDWQPLFHLLCQYHFPSPRNFSHPESLLKQHASQLVKVIRLARRFFAGQAGEQIWASLQNYLSPFDNVSCRAFSLIALFVPTHQPTHAAALLPILPRFQQYESWYDHSPSALVPFFSLYARIAKHQVGAFSLLPHLPTLFNTYLQILELDVGGTTSANNTRTVTAYAWLNEREGNALETCSSAIATIIVYHLHLPKTEQHRSALSLLAQFLHTIATYYHPSNQGKWTGSLAMLLEQLGVQYAKRRGKELNKTVSYSEANFLPVADNSFVSVMLPIALQALFSKSQSMVQAAEKWLRHVSCFHPSLVLPAFLEHAHAALADLSSPHRMLSVMQALANLAPILFHRRFYPQGARQLGELLWACLPGIDAIDPVKTALTLTWFTIVFYHIPLIDARKTDALSKSRIDRHDAATPRVVEKISARFKQVSEAASVQDEPIEEDSTEEELSNPVDAAADDTDAEDDARTVTFRFEDWSLAFLDSVFKVLSTIDKFAKKDFLDVHAARLLGKVLQAFFASVSSDIYLTCANKIVQQVLSNYQANAAKQWGIIVSKATAAHPEVLLPKLFDPLYTRLVTHTKTGDTSTSKLKTLANNELEWALFLLAQVVKQAAGAGPTQHILLPYKDRLLTIYHLTIVHEDRDVRKVSNKLLRNFLSALSTSYPAEWRPFDSRQWSETEQWKHWNNWCDYQPKDEREELVIDPDTVWHIPSAQELKVVEDIVNTELRAPLRLLLDWGVQTQTEKVSMETEVKDAGATTEQANSSSSSSAGKNDGPLERALTQVINIIRGAQTVLGDVAGIQVKKEVDEEEPEEVKEPLNANLLSAPTTHIPVTPRGTITFSCSRCPLITVTSSRPIPPIKADQLVEALHLFSLDSLRSFLLRIFHDLSTRLFTALRSNTPTVYPSLKAITLLIKLLSYTLMSYGVNEQKLSTEQYVGSLTRQWLREYRSGYVVTARPLLILRAYQHHQLRLLDSSKGQIYTEDVKAVLTDLQQFSINDFAHARTKAKKALLESIKHYPQSIDYTIQQTVSVLTDRRSTAEQISGALELLADTNIIALCGRRWSRLSLVVEALAQGLTLKDDKVEILVQSYYTSLFPTLYPLHTTLPAITETSVTAQGWLTEKQVTIRNVSIKRYNQKTIHLYRSLITSLYKSAQNQTNTLHWKYQLMATAFLFILLRPDALVSTEEGETSYTDYPTIVQFFFHTLHNDLAPMRLIAIEAVSNILGTHSLAKRENNRSFAVMPAALNTQGREAITVASPSASVTKTGKILDTTVIHTEEDWLNTAFYDYLYSGWLDETDSVTTVYKKIESQPEGQHEYAMFHTGSSPFFSFGGRTLHPSPLSLSTSLLQHISELLSKHFSAIVDNLVHHHPTLAPVNEGQQQQQQGTGAGDVISSLAYTHFAGMTWPHTRISTASKAFDHTHCDMIRGLVEAIPSLAVVDGLIDKELRRLLVKVDEQDHQCTAAEIIAGVIRGSKHLSFTRQQRIQQMLLPIILSALSNSTPDAVPHWSAALRVIYSNTDPRRLSWLSRALLHSAFQSLPETSITASTSFLSTPSHSSLSEVTSPLAQFKRFRFLLAMLIEHGYRSAALGGWILHKLIEDRWLYSAYKQIRSEVGWLIFLTAENYFKVKPSTKTIHSQLELVPPEPLVNFLNHVISTLNGFAPVLYQNKGAEEKKEAPNNNHSSSTGRTSPGADTSTPVVDEVKADVVMSDGNTASDASADSSKSVAHSAKLFLETSLSALLLSSLVGSMVAVSPLYQSYLSHIIRAQHVTDVECAALGKQVARIAAWVSLKGVPTQVTQFNKNLNLPSSSSAESSQQGSSAGVSITITPTFNTSLVIDNVCHTISSLLQDPLSSWHIRVSALKYLQILIPRHSLLLNAAQVNQLETAIVDRLMETQVEVREQAALTLSSLLGACLSHPATAVIGFSSSLHVSDHVQRLQKKLMRAAKTSYRDQNKKINTAALAKRHGGVLGLLALISCHPYDLPAHLPPLLSFLSAYINDPQPISTNVRKSFAEFLRTHKDEWERFKEKFSEEELEAVNNVQSAPTYFA